VLDLAFAMMTWVVVLQVTSVRGILQSIAAGLLGRDSFRGGWRTAALGAFLHVLIAYGWTVVFLVAVRSWPWLRRAVGSLRGAVWVGLAYGPLVWLAMQRVVLPLSRARPMPVFTWLFLVCLVQHALMVGLPIVLLVRTGTAGGGTQLGAGRRD
jgi:hypothetical protein